MGFVLVVRGVIAHDSSMKAISVQLSASRFGLKAES
jgi:hypothetical protein